MPYALFGHYELWLWMVTSVAISLSGVIFAGRIAYQLVGVEDGDRRPAIVAAAFAGLALLGIENYTHFILSFQSDTMIVALCLGSIDQAIAGRPRWALAIGTLASLGRPEVWAWLGPWSLWVWFKQPSIRKWLIGGLGVHLLHVVRRPDDHQPAPVAGRAARAALPPGAQGEQDRRHVPSLHRVAVAPGSAGGVVRDDRRLQAAQLDRPCRSRPPSSCG